MECRMSSRVLLSMAWVLPVTSVRFILATTEGVLVCSSLHHGRRHYPKQISAQVSVEVPPWNPPPLYWAATLNPFLLWVSTTPQKTLLWAGLWKYLPHKLSQTICKKKYLMLHALASLLLLCRCKVVPHLCRCASKARTEQANESGNTKLSMCAGNVSQLTST